MRGAECVAPHAWLYTHSISLCIARRHASRDADNSFTDRSRVASQLLHVSLGRQTAGGARHRIHKLAVTLHRPIRTRL